MTLRVYGQQVFLMWNYHLHNSAQQLLILFSTTVHSILERFWAYAGQMSLQFICGVTQIHPHTSRHTYTGVPGLQCCGPPAFISLNTWWSSTLLRSQQSPPSLNQTKPVIPHLPSCPCQRDVGAVVVQSSQEGSNSSMLHQWTRKGGCDGHGLFIDRVWSEQGRGERGGRGGRGLHGGNVVWK